ncbi:MAG TPA: ABC transporter ATP-binding protein [Candidatus Saccharimonadales bacterium]|nr:ABC transporter ATP-binding protein [Candidatus Saccharimonadales bacterium]
MEKKVVTFHRVVKEFDGFKALSDLSFSINEGGLYGLIGPNGAGKSTAIRIMTGLIKATSGKVDILGYSPQDVEVRPLVGYMPQEMALYQDLTVRENLEFFGKLYSISKKDLNRRIVDLLDFVELTKWDKTIVANLSGGMKHRTSLAVALLSKPKLLVLDEPTVGVDPELRASFWQRFEDMRADGTTILLTTHYMDEARRCEMIGLINHGRLIAEGTPKELLVLTGTHNLEDAFLSLTRRKKQSET